MTARLCGTGARSPWPKGKHQRRFARVSARNGSHGSKKCVHPERSCLESKPTGGNSAPTLQRRGFLVARGSESPRLRPCCKGVFKSRVHARHRRMLASKDFMRSCNNLLQRWAYFVQRRMKSSRRGLLGQEELSKKCSTEHEMDACEHPAQSTLHQIGAHENPV